MRTWVGVTIAAVAGIGIAVAVWNNESDKETVARLSARPDVRAYIEQQTKNGHRVELNGDTLTIYDCTAKKRWFAEKPAGLHIECVHGFDGIVWTLE